MKVSCLAETLGVLLLGLSASTVVQAQAGGASGSILPRPPVPFTGKLEPVEQDSTMSFPVTVKAPAREICCALSAAKG